MLTERSKEGWLLIDHKACGGLPLLVPGAPAHERAVEMAVLICCHCTQPLIKNPWRTRERARCRMCWDYICDNCAYLMKQPGYVHLPWRVVCELVQSGEAVLLPGSTHGEPKLLFVKGTTT